MDTTFAHLNAELARIDLLIHKRIEAMDRMARAAASIEVNPASLHMTVNEALRILQQPFGEADAVEEDPEAEAGYAIAFARIEAQIAQIVAESDEIEEESRIVRLATLCDLTRFDLDCLLIALAPSIDLRYERLFGFLHDDLTRRRATANLMLDLLAPGGPDRLLFLDRFGERAPLMRHRLLNEVAEPGVVQPVLLNQGMAVNQAVVSWLLGDYHPDAALADYVEYTASDALWGASGIDAEEDESLPEMDDADEEPAAALSPVRPANDPAAVLSAAQKEVIQQAVAADAFLVLQGKDRGMQTAAQRSLAALAGTPLLTLDMHAAARTTGEQRTELGIELRRDLRELVALFLRDAGLIRATAAIVGWDSVLEDGAPPAALLALLTEYDGPVTIAGENPWRSHAVTRTRRFTWLELPIPDYAQRRELLTSMTAHLEAEESIDVVALAGRYRLTGEQMEGMLSTALDRARQGGRGLRNADLFAAARDHSSPRLASLARKLALRYEWDDLILPDDQIERLRELVGMVQGRAQVLDEWGLLRKLAPSYGVTALFAGSPGTGKTMAAEVIAKALDLDVFKIDLSGMVSKYIGETEKNLEKVFHEAENTSAILFFDEADAIFGKRSEVKDAQDRYANIETSYLLQRMEAYDGVTILSTNLRANLDEAFTRRMNTIVDFPFPDEEERLRIWQTLYPKQVPSAPDIDLPLLARRFRIAGGSIRNILVAAAYFASVDGGVLAMRHLMHGTRRELQKLGRLMEESDFVRG